MTYNLEKIRYDNRLTQQQLADLMGVTKSYIGQIETGKSKLSKKASQKISELISSGKLLSCDKEALYLQKDLSPEEKQDLIKEKIKEQFDITEKNYELIFDGLANNQEVIILFLKALNGDHIAKQFMKNMFHN